MVKYLAIYFAGPIRSAGGTEQALILIIGDHIRRRLGLDHQDHTVHLAAYGKSYDFLKVQGPATCTAATAR
jgi:DNA polymerase II large subunit